MLQIIFLALCSLFVYSPLFAASPEFESPFHRTIAEGSSFAQHDPKGSSNPSDLDIPQIKYKSMEAAYAWGIFGTAIPITGAVLLANYAEDGQGTALIASLFLAGSLIGPSMGQFYAESPGRGALGFGIRVVGATLAAAGIATAFSNALCGWDESDLQEHNCHDNDDGESLLWSGGFVYLSGALFSFIDTGFAIKRLNTSTSESQFGWHPRVIPGKNGAFQTGLMAWAHF